MVNILPTETKLELKRHYFWRRRLMALMSLLVLGILSLILGLTLYWVVEISQGGSASLFKKEGAKEDAKSYDELASELKKTSQMIRRLSASNSLLPSGVLAQIATFKNNGIKINSFEFTGDPGGAKIIIKGKSFSRKSLTDFLDKLKNSPVFVSVDSPLSNLISEGETDYSINLLLATSTSP